MSPFEEDDVDGRAHQLAGTAAAASTVILYASPLAMLLKVSRCPSNIFHFERALRLDGNSYPHAAGAAF